MDYNFHPSLLSIFAGFIIHSDYVATLCGLLLLPTLVQPVGRDAQPHLGCGSPMVGPWALSCLQVIKVILDMPRRRRVEFMTSVTGRVGHGRFSGMHVQVMSAPSTPAWLATPTAWIAISASRIQSRRTISGAPLPVGKPWGSSPRWLRRPSRAGGPHEDGLVSSPGRFGDLYKLLLYPLEEAI